MGFSTAHLRRAIAALRQKLEAEQSALNALDGQIGDGDLGITLVKAARALDELAPSLPPDLGAAFQQSAQAVMKVSSSSFGTLFASTLLAASKTLKGRSEAPWSEIPGLLRLAADTVAARGKASLGDKTVLDALDAAASATAGVDHPATLLAAARAATAQTLDAFRNRPCRIGRARIFGDKTVGLDDPGMKAFAVMLAALATA